MFWLFTMGRLGFCEALSPAVDPQALCILMPAWQHRLILLYQFLNLLGFWLIPFKHNFVYNVHFICPLGLQHLIVSCSLDNSEMQDISLSAAYHPGWNLLCQNLQSYMQRYWSMLAVSHFGSSVLYSDRLVGISITYVLLECLGNSLWYFLMADDQIGFSSCTLRNDSKESWFRKHSK